MKFERRDYLLIFVLLSLSLFSMRKLIFSDLLIFWDWPGIGPYYGIEFNRLLNVWSFNNLGQPQGIATFFIIPYIFAYIFGNVATSNAWALMFMPVSGMSMYFLARKFTAPSASFIAALIYMFNPFVLDRFLQAHLGVLLGYSIFPVFFIVMLKCFEERNTLDRTAFYAVILGMLLAFAGGASHFLYLMPFVLLNFIIFNYLLHRKSFIKHLMLLVGILLISFILLLPFYAYVFINPPFQNTPTLINTDFLDVLSGQNNILNIIRLVEHPGPGFNAQVGYWKITYWTLPGLTAPLLAFLSLIFHEKKHRYMVIFISLLGLFSLLLSTGTTYFKETYEFLYLNFPFFYAFRESTKFLGIVALSYAFLAAIFTDYLFKYDYSKIIHNLRLRISSNGVALLVGIVIVSAHLISSQPLLLSGDLMLSETQTPYKINEKYQQAGSWVNAQEGLFRVVILPYDNYIFHTWHAVSYKPALGMDLSFLGMTHDTFEYANYMFSNLIDNRTDRIGILLNTANVKYLLIGDDIFNEQRPDAYTNKRYKISPEEIKKILNSQREFVVAKKKEGYTIYENPYFEPHIEIMTNPIIAAGDRQLLKSLSYLPDFKSNPLVFANQQPNPEDAFELSSTVVLNKNLTDLVFSLVDKRYKTNLYDLANPYETPNPLETPMIQRTWVRSDNYEYETSALFGRGAMTRGGGYAITKGNASLMKKMELDNGSYEIWVHVVRAPGRGSLVISVDRNVLELDPSFSTFTGFEWMKAGEINLDRGMHELQITSSNGESAVDQIIVVPSDVLLQKERMALDLLKNRSFIYLYEGERFLQNTYRDEDASDRQAARIGDSDSVPIEAPVDGYYTFFVRAKGTNINIGIDGTQKVILLNDTFGFYESGALYLKKGEYNAVMQGSASIDLFGIFASPGNGHLNDFLPGRKIKYELIEESPTKYILNYSAEEPVMIILKESYHPLWKAYMDGIQINSTMVNSYANGFYVDGTSGGRASIEFTLQKKIEQTAWVSIGSLGVMVLFMFMYLFRIKRRRVWLLKS